MTISHKDNDLKYMDITEKVPMSESEVNQLLKGKFRKSRESFLEAQENMRLMSFILLAMH